METLLKEFWISSKSKLSLGQGQIFFQDELSFAKRLSNSYVSKIFPTIVDHISPHSVLTSV